MCENMEVCEGGGFRLGSFQRKEGKVSGACRGEFAVPLMMMLLIRSVRRCEDVEDVGVLEMWRYRKCGSVRRYS